MKMLACALAAFLCAAAFAFSAQAPAGQAAAGAARQPMSFFVTSKGLGDGANLGGLTGADYLCQTLAEAVGSTKVFHAYLSTRSGDNAATVINARARIGTGPWYNAKGARIAQNVAELHSDRNALNKQTALTEKGEMINGPGDVMTGSRPDGTSYPATRLSAEYGVDHTCSNYTSNKKGAVQLGSSDRTGNGATSWNSSRESAGCSQADLVSAGSTGLFYCFAID